MTKKTPPPPCTQESEVREWLGGKGFPLEFKVEREFRKYGWSTTMGAFAASSDEVQREVDVWAWRSSTGQNLNKPATFSASVIVECKHSKDNAWVLLGRGEISTLQIDAYLPFARAVTTDDLLRMSYMAGDDGHARRVVVSHSATSTSSEKPDGRDVAYGAVDKVVDLAHATVARFEKRDQKMRELWLLWPVVLTNGPIWRTWLNEESGRMELQQIPFGHLVWSGRGSPTRVDVVSLDGLDEYLSGLGAEVESFREWFNRRVRKPAAVQGLGTVGDAD